MRLVDKSCEARGVAEAPRRREQANRLIAPGGIERMLGHRHQLEMREAHFRRIGDKILGEVVVAQEGIVLAALP